MEDTGNLLHLCGTLTEIPTYGHEVFSEHFYHSTLAVKRLSGAEDLLPITISERLMEECSMTPGSALCFDGQLRSYNKIVDGAGKLLITGFVQHLLPVQEDENPNQIQLTGTLCKEPSYRTTPFGREIADLMLAVNRAYGKSDYIPCITWGRTARFASHLKVGDKVQVMGRFQSRAYQKMLSDGSVLNKMAYEVSVGRLTLAEPSRAPHSDTIAHAMQEDRSFMAGRIY